MAKTIPNYDNLDKEVQHQIKEAHQYMKQLNPPSVRLKTSTTHFIYIVKVANFQMNWWQKTFIRQLYRNQEVIVMRDITSRFLEECLKNGRRECCYFCKMSLSRCPPAVKEMDRLALQFLVGPKITHSSTHASTMCFKSMPT